MLCQPQFSLPIYSQMWLGCIYSKRSYHFLGPTLRCNKARAKRKWGNTSINFTSINNSERTHVHMMVTCVHATKHFFQCTFPIFKIWVSYFPPPNHPQTRKPSCIFFLVWKGQYTNLQTNFSSHSEIVYIFEGPWNFFKISHMQS